MGALGICTSPNGVLGCKSPTCPGGNINSNLAILRSDLLDKDSEKPTWNAIASDLLSLFPHEQEQFKVTFNDYEIACLDSTPVANDTYLANLYSLIYAKQAEIKQVEGWIEQSTQRLNPSYKYYRQNDVTSLNEKITKYNLKKQLKISELDNLFKEAQPYQDAWLAGGKWSRAFLVTNGNGHIHKTMDCSTCYPTTEFVWLPQYSGQNEDLLIKDAGSKICTVCYPNAPVDYLKEPSNVYSPEDKLKRIQKEEEKKIKEAEKLAKSITMPDGSPLKNRYGIIKTERTAEIEAVSAMEMILGYEAKGTPLNAKAEEEYRRDYETIVSALAFKRGTTEEEQRKIILTKAKNKVKKW